VCFQKKKAKEDLALRASTSGRPLEQYKILTSMETTKKKIVPIKKKIRMTGAIEGRDLKKTVRTPSKSRDREPPSGVKKSKKTEKSNYFWGDYTDQKEWTKSSGGEILESARNENKREKMKEKDSQRGKANREFILYPHKYTRLTADKSSGRGS